MPTLGDFFAGRLISCAIYVGGAAAVKHTDFGRVVSSSLTSPLGVAIQVVLLVGVMALARVDWTKRLFPSILDRAECGPQETLSGDSSEDQAGRAASRLRVAGRSA